MAGRTANASPTPHKEPYRAGVQRAGHAGARPGILTRNGTVGATTGRGARSVLLVRQLRRAVFVIMPPHARAQRFGPGPEPWAPPWRKPQGVRS
jgi:hypothetical protein